MKEKMPQPISIKPIEGEILPPLGETGFSVLKKVKEALDSLQDDNARRNLLKILIAEYEAKM